MSTLEIIAAIDGLITLTNKLVQMVQDKREVGEMTPEEEAALDAALEKKFASWKKAP